MVEDSTVNHRINDQKNAKLNVFFGRKSIKKTLDQFKALQFRNIKVLSKTLKATLSLLSK